MGYGRRARSEATPGTGKLRAGAGMLGRRYAGEPAADVLVGSEQADGDEWADGRSRSCPHLYLARKNGPVWKEMALWNESTVSLLF